ncbi:MAG: type II toxin-antitoxin system VapC family toxin [Deferribacteres bacterium]|nr:type II toxin-antitoxin system VapC family toxin [Deferribacteres bacterium]
MILLDTHAWIWWSTSSSKLSKRAQKAINASEIINISAISCWEVAMLVSRKRLVLDRDVEVWIDLALKLPRVRLVPLTPHIAVRSTRLEKGFTGDPADCILVATALEYGSPVVSKDERLKHYPGLSVIW